MNNIHEKDWADEGWSGHTGMDSFSEFCIRDGKTSEAVPGTVEVLAEQSGTAKQERSSAGTT